MMDVFHQLPPGLYELRFADKSTLRVMRLGIDSPSVRDIARKAVGNIHGCIVTAMLLPQAEPYRLAA
jgi:hypothetical protein